ncbi:MAG: phenylalanine--tRNA ligase subunit beta [Deltaproteobacteria bacterium]
MRISLAWLAELVSLPPTRDLVHGLTFAGLEVERVEERGAGLEGVVVAKILESSPHPKADRLSVTKVDAGGETLQIVCGAKNYAVGDQVPLARVGVTLPGGQKIEAASLRGVQSFGMLCSERELGLSLAHEGLWILPAELHPGTPVAEALGLRDTILELNVTPNRPDCLSHLGVAREVAAIFRLPRTVPTPAPAWPPFDGRLPPEPTIEAVDRCGLYLGLAVGGGRALVSPSPLWMRSRLEACGIRAIGLAVDVTNLVLLELGQPLHAFDLRRVGEGIRVRRAQADERLVTLDGVERKLASDDLVIAAGAAPVALAGVMGGEASGVLPDTEALYLEAAWFQPAGIRRSARRHGLHSESSHRFERGVDPGLAPMALRRAVELLAGAVPGLGAAAPQRAEGQRPVARAVALRFERVGALLGSEVSADESRGKLSALGLAMVSNSQGTGRFEVPSHRFDLEEEVDLIEEVARLRGFERIPRALPPNVLPPTPPRRHARPLAAARAVLSDHGFFEALNLSFSGGPSAEPFAEGAPITLQNPLKSEDAQLRSSVLPGLLQNLRTNLARLPQVAGAPPPLRLYELGVTFRWPGAGERTEGPAHERLRLGLLAHGPRAPVGWATGREPFDFYDLKGLVEALLERLGAHGEARFERCERPWLHPRSATRLTVGAVELGAMGELHPAVADRLELPRGIFAAELDAEGIFSRSAAPRPGDVPRFPAVLRDLALVVDEPVGAETARSLLRAAGGELLEAVLLFDVFQGGSLPAGKKSLAFSLRFRAKDRTLTDDEVAKAHAELVAAAEEKLGAALRG